MASTTVNPSQDNGLPRNFLGVAIEGPSREGFYFAPAYRLARDGHGFATNNPPHIYPDGKSHDWTLEYVPAMAAGEGRKARRGVRPRLQALPARALDQEMLRKRCGVPLLHR